MGDVIHLRPLKDPATALREIADMIECGDINADTVTVVAGLDVFQCGVFDDDQIAQEAVFSLTYAIQKIMSPVVALSEGREVE